MTQPLTDDQIAAIHNRAKAATANPQLAREPNSHGRPDILSLLTPDGDEIADHVRIESDADLWHHARADVLALLAEIARLRAENQRQAARIAELDERDAWLTALEHAGVDNWQGYEYAAELHEEWTADGQP